MHPEIPFLIASPLLQEPQGQRQQKGAMVGKGFRKGRKGKFWAVDTNQLWGTADLQGWPASSYPPTSVRQEQQK